MDPALIRYRSLVFEHIGGIRQGRFCVTSCEKRSYYLLCLAESSLVNASCPPNLLLSVVIRGGSVIAAAVQVY